jgi:hypothetical protein
MAAYQASVMNAFLGQAHYRQGERGRRFRTLGFADVPLLLLKFCSRKPRPMAGASRWRQLSAVFDAARWRRPGNANEITPVCCRQTARVQRLVAVERPAMANAATAAAPVTGRERHRDTILPPPRQGSVQEVGWQAPSS